MTGPQGDGRPEPTFADVMNGFSFDSGRKSKRRLWGRRRGERTDERPAVVEEFEDRQPAPVGDGYVGQYGGQDDIDERYEDPVDAVGSSTSVRPYAWTRGRTRTGYALEIETLVSTSPRGREQLALLQVEHRAVAELCQQAKSVAEVGAMLKVPLGVAKVLVGDMAGLGLVAVHQSVSANGDVPDLALMERVLSGLRRL